LNWPWKDSEWRLRTALQEPNLVLCEPPFSSKVNNSIQLIFGRLTFSEATENKP
jgi:hypothetical protein